MNIATNTAHTSQTNGAVRLLAAGDSGLLVRFATSLSDSANKSAIEGAHKLVLAAISGVEEVVPSLVSVLLRYDPKKIGFFALCNEVRLALAAGASNNGFVAKLREIEIVYGGDDGPDLACVARLCQLDVNDFIAAHCRHEIRVLATGFAPGFIYCGLHEQALSIPRRVEIHPRVKPGSILFAAGQTAITATSIPTGWHVIGRTDFINFQPRLSPPILVAAGDMVRFSPLSA
ncbi:Allophanate hydrolase 2 subunit 1 [hydrothermal vent metagenome]|uniref:Allophanate hydrolase 2 subunit 1 n=1 Tax=hydrothermal vent metagenome TaxID=652676 RepID=A0A3B0U2P1_9ZZZZ